MANCCGYAQCVVRLGTVGMMRIVLDNHRQANPSKKHQNESFHRSCPSQFSVVFRIRDKISAFFA